MRLYIYPASGRRWRAGTYLQLALMLCSAQCHLPSALFIPNLSIRALPTPLNLNSRMCDVHR